MVSFNLLFTSLLALTSTLTNTNTVLAAATSDLKVGEYAPPNFEKGDVRGPCPAFNVLANHGYLCVLNVVIITHNSCFLIWITVISAFWMVLGTGGSVKFRTVV
jgi:hypothetical protein